MNQWSDDELVARLTASLTAHEVDADPATAQRIALSSRAAARRRWPVVLAAAAVVVLVAGLASYVVHDRDPAPEPSGVATGRPVPTAAVTPAVAGTNRALAAAAAVRVLADVPLPPGSTRSVSAPAPSLRRVGCQCGEVDPTLSQTGWWVVALPFDKLVAYYRSHTDANTGSAYAGPAASSVQPEGELDWEVPYGSDAFSNPEVVLSYASLGPDSTGIRLDVTLAARFDRTAETTVPDTVTSVGVTVTVLGDPGDVVRRATLTDPEAVADVVTAFDSLRGAFAHLKFVGLASPGGTTYQYALTFHWPGHTLAVDPGQPLGDTGRGLTLDGIKLPETLATGSLLDDAVKLALDAP